MSLTYAKAPLVEIITELIWYPPQIPAAPEGQRMMPIPLLGDTKQEDFFMRLSNHLSNLGFQHPERLLPPGFVTLLHQSAMRFKKDPVRSPVLYQAGPGIFSAHGLPPYRSWEDFSPDVERGIRALLQSRDPSEKNAPFAKISLRYIDAFTEELTQGRDEITFIGEVLGISVNLPATVIDLQAPGAKPQMSLQLAFSTTNEMIMTVNLAQGHVNAKAAVVMDTIVSCTKGVSPELDDVMATLRSAHELTRRAFLGLTAPIHNIMEPRGER